MVRTLARGLIGLAAVGAGLARAEGPAADPARAVGSALGKGAYPWYDSPKDAIRPVRVPTGNSWWSKSSSSSKTSSSASSSPKPAGAAWDFGNGIATGGFAVGLAALIGLLIWFWRIYEPSADADLGPEQGRGEPSRVEELPANLRRGFDPADAWAEAIRRRDRGDLAGAILCLFAHQLLTLGRLGLVRLAPGRTGRQLLRSVSDPEFRGLVAPTLRLFEAAYYGHHEPSAADFAAAWAGAEAFERRAAEGVAR